MARTSKKPRSQPAPVRNLIIVSDTHAGCKLAVIGAPIHLDEGGTYHPSDFQKQIYRLWRQFWDQWVPEVTKGEPYDVVHGGDAIDGVHHNSTSQISHNFQDQIRIAEALMRPVVERCRALGGSYYHIRGTEAHVGKSAVYEEQLAERLGAVPNDQGQFARYDLWKRVGGADGPLVHILHHIGTTSSAAHEASAVNAEMTAEYVEAARWHRIPPDYIVRGHRHRSIAVDLDSARGYAAAITLPAWQGKTSFAWKVAGARLTEPQFGGIVIRHGDEEHYYRRRVWCLDRSKEA